MPGLIVLLAVLTGFTGAAWGQLFGDGFDANDACIDLKINYRICGSCPFCWPCADIRYWVPKWEVEAGRDNDSRGRPSRGEGELHFFQVKVKPMTKGFFQQPCNESRSCVGGCFRPTIGAVVDHFYDSRRDADWLLNNDRMTRERTMPPWAQLMMIAPPTGTWGRALPRAGYVIHTSKLAASGMASLRGFNIARYPYDLWPDRGHYRLDSCRLPGLRAACSERPVPRGGTVSVHAARKADAPGLRCRGIRLLERVAGGGSRLRKGRGRHVHLGHLETSLVHLSGAARLLCRAAEGPGRRQSLRGAGVSE